MASPTCVRRAKHRALAVGIVVVSLAGAGYADAPPVPVELEWHAPNGCPSREQILGRVGKLIEPSSRSGSTIQAHVEIGKQRGGFALRATLRAGGVEQTRTAESRTCAALGEAAAIMLATAIDAGRAPPNLPDSNAEAPPEEPVSRDDRPPSSASGAPRAAGVLAPPAVIVSVKKPSVSIGLGIAAAFDFGTLPRPTSSLEASAHVERDRLRFGVSGALWRPIEQSFSERTRGGARFELYNIGAFGCWTPWGNMNLRFGGCVEMDVTHLKFEGVEIRRPAVTRVLWPTARAGGLVEAALGRGFTLYLRADAAFALGVAPFVLTTATDNLTVHEVGVPAFRLTIGGRGDLF